MNINVITFILPTDVRPVYRLTSEAKHVLCECAEYQLANSPTHDHVAAHILRQLGDRQDLPSSKKVQCVYDDDYDDTNEDCYQWWDSITINLSLKYILYYVILY